MPRTASEPRPQDKRHTIQWQSASVYTLHSLHYRPRPHYIVWGRTSTERTAVFVLRNAATLTVPRRQLLSTRSNVSIVLYGLRPARRCSPGSVATGYLCSPKHDRHPSLSPVTTKLLVTHCVTAFEFCWRMASSVYKYSSCRSAVYTACVMLSADSTRRESHAAAQDVFQPVLTPKYDMWWYLTTLEVLNCLTLSHCVYEIVWQP